MKPFPYAHATHPQWRMAAALVLAQLRAQLALPGAARAPSLALLYITDHYASEAEAILEHLSAELPEVTDWAGTVGVGIAANNVEYFDEPALAVMLCDLSPDQYRVFSGVAPLAASGRAAGVDGFEAHTALVHADGHTPDLAELITEMADRTTSGYLFGGLVGSRSDSVQFAFSSAGTLQGHGAASGVFHGGLSGVAFGPGVDLISRVTQGAQPVDRERTVTAADGNLVLSLDNEPALDVLLRELGISLEQPETAMPRLRATLVGLTSPIAEEGVRSPQRRGQFGPEVTVRHIIGLDPGRRGVAIADVAPVGSRLAFCERNVQAARADLIRVCAEVREELEPEELSLPLATALETPEADAAPQPARRIAGAVYVSCAGRGGPHFGSPSAELQIVRRALGDVPLVGFFAGGEIAHHRLYGYTGVLTVFTMPT
ncbi:FIST C-terminal domain-containing protein [Hydrogenophaga aromaticivorans]|uniref:FIST signal transduction protein n=1 Tax=Hydrogenophaga aromaticivorans TaxID=2610898 RepID=UPI001B3969D4|nr:FIST N-terminal domain-containing protein [Hydrogenophaga aromaticivorans]MBQ0922267.1 FIST C-terminal domain-containing protein [Hydrogenophaga aromaticivorans]